MHLNNLIIIMSQSILEDEKQPSCQLLKWAYMKARQSIWLNYILEKWKFQDNAVEDTHNSKSKWTN